MRGIGVIGRTEGHLRGRENMGAGLERECAVFRQELASLS